jgi:hypothetical protein
MSSAAANPDDASMSMPEASKIWDGVPESKLDRNRHHSPPRFTQLACLRRESHTSAARPR